VPSFTRLQSSLIGSGFFYEKSSRHAAYNFNQSAQSLYRNQPRFPFEYYININLNNIDTAKDFIQGFFDSASLSQLMPLVKTVEMPSMKIESTPLNQYNRKRISQTKIAFEPIKMVFHDVADGKTLAFWDMYYRYYFADGNEPGKNQVKDIPTFGGTYQNEPGGAGAGRGSADFAARDPRRLDIPPSPESSTNTNGDKSAIQNIISDTLDNHNFGFNLPTVQNIRNLIQTIDIYQVHGGRFNQVTLVNPRISAFTHDVLSYAVGDKTLELTFTWEYEYAYYTIQNMKLEGGEPNNSSTIEQFTHGDFLELSNLSFTQSDPDFIESPNPSIPDGADSQNIGNNVQTDLGTVTNPYVLPPVTIQGYSSSLTPNAGPPPSSSSLSGIVDISPPAPVDQNQRSRSYNLTGEGIGTPSSQPYNMPAIQTRPFDNTAAMENMAGGTPGSTAASRSKSLNLQSGVQTIPPMYPDMDRASGP